MEEFSRNVPLLLWKRFVCATRDIKGLLYELAVPVLTIAFVLLILKLNVNPAGPSIQLNAPLYEKHCADTNKGERVDPPEAILSPASAGQWTQLGGAVVGTLAMGSGFTIVPSAHRNSLNISHDLLVNALRHNRHAPRIAAFTANDTLTVTTSRQAARDAAEFAAKIAALRLPAGTELPDFPPLPRFPGGLPASPTSHGSPARPLAVDDTATWETHVPATILHNSTYFHALPVAYTELLQARARVDKGPSAFVRVRNHPLPLTRIASLYIDTILTLFAAIFLLLPFCYMPGTLTMFWVRERELRAKHVQFVSGVTPVQYWTACYLWDMASFSVVDALFIAVLTAYGNDEFIGTPARCFATYLLVFAYGLAVVPLSYLLSSLFTSASAAQVGIAAFHFVSGFVLLVISSILMAIPSTRVANRYLKALLFRLMPPFVLGEGLVKLSLVALVEELVGDAISPYEWRVLGRPLAYLSTCAVVYFLAVLAVDSGHELAAARNWASEALRSAYNRARGQQQQRRYANVRSRSVSEAAAVPAGGDDDDEDVASEEMRVRALIEGTADGEPPDAAILVHRLRKVYPPIAVRGLSLAVPRQQCFGLLGTNGAGKTSTLKMLTADVAPTSGRAFLNGIPVSAGVRAIRQQIGYCPQFNPLLPMLSVSETLLLYGRLRGLPLATARRRAGQLADQLRLGPHADKMCGALSGGNKRKVSLGIALVGDPPVLFLDEPSSGMDPVTRRWTWDLIAGLSARRCVVLTTHSMEECEALCGRVGIMAHGRLRCIGTLQHLKSRFGTGYYVEVGTDGEATAGHVGERLRAAFPSCRVLEAWGGKIKVKIADPKVPIARVFAEIERVKQDLRVQDYSVSQSSLEQIFIQMVRDDESGVRQREPGRAQEHKDAERKTDEKIQQVEAKASRTLLAARRRLEMKRSRGAI